jgi:hypothetical protein
VENHLRELGSRRETLIAVMKPEGEVVERIAAVERIKGLEAEDRAAVKAVLEMDFDRALTALPEAEPEAPPPRM